MAGMLIAVVTTLVTHEVASLPEILGAIAIGGAIVLAMVLMAIFAPFLGTVDPTALAPARRSIHPRGRAASPSPSRSSEPALPPPS